MRTAEPGKIADLMAIPSIGDVGPETREELVEDFEAYFPEEARKLILDTPAADLEFHRHEEGDYWKLEWDNGLESEGQRTIGYHFSINGGAIRLVRTFSAG